ncbi:hypothetical protein [Clostridium lacusfryxellense]|uniref:hypothetical protein n=1 Tax=Clostridium lacusfryxellense TaxID=205328 RepID=UPI001C0AF907|nr:hypothetical protein [Clostridium lacusfryxellense]MBU3111576.1 hypothetical protein [Clostridium lacusfryxellense]
MIKKKSNNNLNSIFNVLGNDMIFSSICYVLCVISALLINSEKNYTHLNSGLFIMVLLYAQLLLIMANIILVNKKGRLINVKVFYQKTEMILRFMNILIINLNLNRFGIDIYLQAKLIIIGCSAIVSIAIIVYQYIKFIKSKDLRSIEGEFDNLTGRIEVNSKELEHISLIGLILYIYSVTLINQEIQVITLALKSLVFYIAISLIIQRIKINRPNLKQNKIYIIISGLIIGFLLNFFLAIILSYYINYINIDDLNGIKDVMFIVAMVFAIPLLKEYTK